MASRLSKLRSRIVVSCVAIFILLSVSRAEERTRCYWCGPLAEQVHRSQRAPSCDVFNLEQHETLCDQGYTHCAIIAVSPPYAESRLCVKFYQDECYSLYCNSTKTWRMVCACRGDLCNGPRTPRETQAFTLLPKFGKAKPHKRNLISHFLSVKTRTPTDDDTIIIINKENDTDYNIQGDQPMHPNENTSNLYTPTPKHDEDKIIIVHLNHSLKNDDIINQGSPSKADNSEEMKMQSMESTNHPVEDKPLASTTKDKESDKDEVDKHLGNEDKNLVNEDKNLVNEDKNLVDPDVVKHIDIAETGKNSNNSSSLYKQNDTEVSKQLDKLDKAELDKNISKSEAGKLTSAEINNPTTVTTIATIAAQITKENSDSEMTTTTMKSTSQIVVAVQSSPAGKMPPAEALQQNVTPTKSLETTTISTVAMTTENHVTTSSTQTTEASNPNKKNSGATNLVLLVIFVISLLLHACI